MIVIFAMISTGFFARKIGWIEQSFNEKFSKLVVNITNPCLILYAVLSFDRTKSEIDVFYLLEIGVLFYLFLMFLAHVLMKFLLHMKENDQLIYELSLAFGNVTFIGIPIHRSLFGAQGVFMSLILNMPFNLIIFTIGYLMIAKTIRNTYRWEFKKILNPGLIAAVIALIIYFLDLSFPLPVQLFLEYMSGITIPASMIIIGSSLSGIGFREVFGDKLSWLIAFIKLIAIPIFVFIIFRIFVKDPMILTLLVLSAAMPGASILVILIRRNGWKYRESNRYCIFNDTVIFSYHTAYQVLDGIAFVYE